MSEPLLKILLAQPRGFCAGVKRAIEIVECALKKYGPPIYVRHEIVHNKWVVARLREKGVIFVEDLDEIPDDGLTVFSAHGVPMTVMKEAKERSLSVFDATCPLVSRVHKEGQFHDMKGHTVVLIGHDGHPEVIGTSGQIPGGVRLVTTVQDVLDLKIDNPDMLAYITQTTLSIDETWDVIEALKYRFPNIKGPDVKNICYATQNRQAAVRELAKRVEMVLVVGSKNSSNSNRLYELASKEGVKAYLIDGVNDVSMAWLTGINTIGITAGASAPEDLVRAVAMHLSALRPSVLETMDGIGEDIHFRLPKELIEDAA